MSTPTKDDMKELAERAVACKHWRWTEGMGIWTGGSIVKRCVTVIGADPAYRDSYGRLTVVHFALPDLNDPATLGCLLALVREAWDMPRSATWCADGWWGVHSPLLNIGFPIRDKKNNSEAAALVAALEAAP